MMFRHEVPALWIFRLRPRLRLQSENPGGPDDDVINVAVGIGRNVVEQVVAPTHRQLHFLGARLLADPLLLRECLAAHGFQPSGRGQFSKGRAKVHFEGTRLVAIPGTGSRIWRSEVGSVPPEAVVALLNGFLATPPFLSQQEIDRRLARTHAAKIALDRIVEIIREAPEAAPSRELRRFLWSLFNSHHLINLWDLRHALDHQQSGWATEVFTAWMNGHVSEELLRQALSDSGEMEGRA